MNGIKNPPIPILMKIGFFIMGIASIGGLVTMIAIGIEKVKSGHGLDTYRTFWLVEFNYIGMLVMFGVLAVALVFAGYLRFIAYKRSRDFERRNGIEEDNT